MRGVLVTTNGRERQCVSEAYDLFNEVRKYRSVDPTFNCFKTLNNGKN